MSTFVKESNPSSGTFDMTLVDTLIKAHEKHLPATLEEIGSNPDQLKKDVAALREWYTYQTHLPQSITDHVLASFIVGCKNSMEIAKMKLDMYYSERRKFPEVYCNTDPTNNELTKSYKTVYTLTLPSLTPDGCAVSILKLRNPDPNLYEALDPVKRLNMIYEVALKNCTMTSKCYLVYDYEHCTHAHVTQLNPLIVKAHLETLKFLPIRVKGLILINCPKFAERTYNLMRNFMGKKLQSRLFIYNEGFTVLSKHIDVDLLPKDYGGKGDYTLDSLNDYWHELLIDNREWLIDESVHNSDESKRPADSKYKVVDEDTYGVDGSFKKLQID